MKIIQKVRYPRLIGQQGEEGHRTNFQYSHRQSCRRANMEEFMISLILLEAAGKGEKRRGEGKGGNNHGRYLINELRILGR